MPSVKNLIVLILGSMTCIIMDCAGHGLSFIDGQSADDDNDLEKIVNEEKSNTTSFTQAR